MFKLFLTTTALCSTMLFAEDEVFKVELTIKAPISEELEYFKSAVPSEGDQSNSYDEWKKLFLKGNGWINSAYRK